MKRPKPQAARKTRAASKVKMTPTDKPSADKTTLAFPATLEANEAARTLFARQVLRPSVRAAVTTQTFSKEFGELDLSALLIELAAQAAAVNNGNLQRPEAMLVAQAHTLDAIFNTLARRAERMEVLSQWETFMRLGLKAQTQCRATLETLATIKNPPVAFVRQANIAHGPQQVNNAPQATSESSSRAQESENRPNELLEQQRNDWLDTRTTQAAGSSNSSVEALEVVNGTKDGRG